MPSEQQGAAEPFQRSSSLGSIPRLGTLRVVMKKLLDKVVAKQRPMLTERQIAVFWRAMIDFGYTNLKIEEVKRAAKQVHDGTYKETNVIAVIMCNQIDEAERDSRARK